ncbi:MAG: MltA domain-containing protein, partial [Bdellovibrionales bacterium]|nr:MltA domain-containing protein [Bdellovibrionales bacterium]
LKDRNDALRLSENKFILNDDLELKTFVIGIRESIKRLNEDPESRMMFGPVQIKKGKYAAALMELLEYIKNISSKNQLYKYLKENFDFYEVYGQKKWGEVFITSYFDPSIKGSIKPTKEFTQALYKTPQEMVTINIDKYAEVFPKWSLFAEQVLEQKSRKAIVRGRLISSKNKNNVPEVVPFYSRKEIDEEKVLKGKNLEIVYVSPIDSFFMQIQGSGIIELPNNKNLRLGYDSQNGHSYVPIGKHLLDIIPLEEMTLQKIEDYLKTLSAEELQEILNLNPSYVFFRELEGSSQTYFSTNVIAGRTIATDYGLFPKGALAYLEFKRPIFNTENSQEPEVWQDTSRFVFDHDTGGAIRGPARVDLYWGKGSGAKQSAGVMKQWGRLTYLVPKNISNLHQELK